MPENLRRPPGGWSRSARAQPSSGDEVRPGLPIQGFHRHGDGADDGGLAAPADESQAGFHLGSHRCARKLPLVEKGLRLPHGESIQKSYPRRSVVQRHFLHVVWAGTRGSASSCWMRSAPACGPLPWVTTTRTPRRAMRAICREVASTLASCSSVVPFWSAWLIALPPNAMTMVFIPPPCSRVVCWSDHFEEEHNTAQFWPWYAGPVV